MATQDVYLITHDEVSDIYQRQYWSASGCEALPLGLDLCNFDGSVNSGLGRSKKWLAAAHGSIHAYCAARLTSMHSFGAWATFGRGWSARVAGIEAQAVVMLTAPAKAKPILVSTANAAATKAKVASTIAHTAAVATGAGAVVAASTLPSVSSRPS